MSAIKLVIRRLADLIRHAWVAVLAPAEDPRKAFASSYTRQRKLLADIQDSLAEVTHLKSSVASLIASTSARLPQLREEARGALHQGREDLARFMVERDLIAREELQELARQLTELEDEERKLVAAESRLAAQVESFAVRREIASVRLTTSETQSRLDESLRNVAGELSNLGIALERAEGKMETMQARAGEIDKMLRTTGDDQTSATRRKEIEHKVANRRLRTRVERELKALRRRRR